MPLLIVRNDITKMAVDAIVNAANSSLLGGGGVDGCIHRAAGEGLLAECRALGGCETGSAKITGAYNLPCRYVIHAVGPMWIDGKHNEREQLESCYRVSLRLAREHACESVAFPLISSGIYGYPKDKALQVAMEVIGSFLLENDMTVYIVVFDKAAYRISEKLFADITEYIDDVYVDAHTDESEERRRRNLFVRMAPKPLQAKSKATPCAAPEDAWAEPEPAPCAAPEDACAKPDMAPCAPPEDARAKPDMTPCAPPEGARAKPKPAPCAPSEGMWTKPTPFSCASAAEDLDARLSRLDESFSQMLLRKIDERGMTDAACYKKANIDRKLFSKIRSDIHYQPSKPTVIAFAISLELSLAETKELLAKAGFALSHSNKFDVIIEYFISRGNYRILEINEALFAFDQSLLGA